MKSMKVFDMLNKIDDLKQTQEKLEKRMNDDDLTGNDSDLMYAAASAIDSYIEELYRKEVKV